MTPTFTWDMAPKSIQSITFEKIKIALLTSYFKNLTNFYESQTFRNFISCEIWWHLLRDSKGNYGSKDIIRIVDVI